MTETRKFNLSVWVLMHIIRSGGNAIKVIVGVRLFIAGQMAVDAHIVQEKLLLKQISSLKNVFILHAKNYTLFTKYDKKVIL